MVKLPCNTAWCVLDLSSPRCGHCDQGSERMVGPAAQLVAVVVVPEAQLVAVALAELEEVQVALVCYFFYERPVRKRVVGARNAKCCLN